MEADAQSGQVVEHGRCGRRQHTRRAKADQRPVEPDDESVVGLDAVHEGHGQLSQLHQLPQAVGGDGDIGDLS